MMLEDAQYSESIWDVAYSEGYTMGKGKAIFEIEARLEELRDGQEHMKGCRCEPCRIIALVADELRRRLYERLEVE